MEHWIAVKATQGLFPSERIARFETVEGEASVFVSSIHLDEAYKFLKVKLIDRDADFALIQVPSQGELTVAKVRRAQLRSAPARKIEKSPRR